MDADPLRVPAGQREFEAAMTDAVSTGGSAWIITRAGELFAGDVEAVGASVAEPEFGRQVTVTICGRELLFQEVAHWTAGLAGEPTDLVLDASITQALSIHGPLTAEDLSVEMAGGVDPLWCTAERANERLLVLEREGWVAREHAGDQVRWSAARKR